MRQNDIQQLTAYMPLLCKHLVGQTLLHASTPTQVSQAAPHLLKCEASQQFYTMDHGSI